MRSGARSCFVVVLMVLCSTLAWGETLDRIVATVNGDIILNSELQDRVRAMKKAMPDANAIDPAKESEFERTVLEQMIRDRLAMAEVKRLKITVTPHEVDEAIAQIKKENHFTDAQFEYMARQDGKTVDQLKEEIKKEMERSRLLDRVLKSKTVITDAQVDAYLKGGGKPTDQANRRRIAVILIPNGKGDKQSEDGETLARDIHKRLKEGADFAKMAKQYSKGPAASEGGDLGFINSEDLAPAIAAATKGLKPGEITDPISTSGGLYIIKILDVQKEKLNAADDSSREKIRRQLFQKEVSRKFEEWIKDLESRAFIQISL